MKRRPPIADLVAHRWLKLDDVGAMICKQLRRKGAAKYAREVDDLHARKRATRRLSAGLPVCCLGHFSPDAPVLSRRIRCHRCALVAMAAGIRALSTAGLPQIPRSSAAQPC